MELHDAPRRLAERITHSASDGSITVATGSGTIVELNATAAALWQLCDGQTEVEEIVTAASSIFSAPRSTIERDIMAVLDQLDEQGLIER